MIFFCQFFGQNMFTINCNEDITLPMLVQYMLGMVQAGSWTLFDDTDRLKKGTVCKLIVILLSTINISYFRRKLLYLEIVLSWKCS